MIDQTTAEKFIETAYKAGAPRDQVENFIMHGYVPLPWQWIFHAASREADKPDGPVIIGAGGARGPGKSHGVFGQIALDDCQRVPRLKCLFLRQTGKAAKESFEDLLDRVVVGRVEHNYNRSNNTLTFPNGSRILLGGFENEKDIDKYIGIEYDVIAVEELNQLTKEKVDKLRGSLRTSKPNWRPRFYCSFNPGGVGHKFVKDLLVAPYRAKQETRTRFIPSTYLDNPHLHVEYITYLEELEGKLGQAWRQGNFDIAEGQFFSEFDHNRHVVEPFAIPASWKKIRSIDPSGRNGTTSCHWYAIDFSGDVWCYREYYWGSTVKDPRTGTFKLPRDADEHARAITELSMTREDIFEEYPYTAVDEAIFAKLGLPESMAEVYQRNGVTGMVPADKKRIAGWDIMHQYLRLRQDGTPKLRFFSTCTEIIRTIPDLVHDEKNPEDVDTNGEDHAADDCRYALQTLRESKSVKPLTKIEQHLREIKERQETDSYRYDYKKRV